MLVSLRSLQSPSQETPVESNVSLPPTPSPFGGRGAEGDRPSAHPLRMAARSPSRRETCACGSCATRPGPAHGPYCYCGPCLERDPLNGR
jgi:hypothetical protein